VQTEVATWEVSIVNERGGDGISLDQEATVPLNKDQSPLTNYKRPSQRGLGTMMKLSLLTSGTNAEPLVKKT